MKLAYNGTQYHGWQKQLNAQSVQQVLEEKLSMICGEKVETTGCGRTDTGVHALDFTAHFDLTKEIPPNLAYKINQVLPADIAIYACEEVAPDFHARFDAVYRSYIYHIHQTKNPFRNDFSWFRPGQLDLDTMNKAAALLLGKKEFVCFCKGEPPNGNYHCEVISAEWKTGEFGLEFHITANRFLRNMVRAIVGTLIETGNGKMTVSDFEQILQNGSRRDAGNSVPACGLYLSEVRYK